MSCYNPDMRSRWEYSEYVYVMSITEALGLADSVTKDFRL